MSWHGNPEAYFSNQKCKGCSGYLRVKYRGVSGCPVCLPVVPASRQTVEADHRASKKKSSARTKNYQPDIVVPQVFRG